MIDSTSETLIPLREATNLIPRRRAGRKAHVSTLFRWTSAGVRGVVLESVQCGGTRCTSREALDRFFQALTEQRQGTAPAVPQSRQVPLVRRTAVQRQRQSEEAGRKLAEMGA
jgi:hypothetical protein